MSTPAYISDPSSRPRSSFVAILLGGFCVDFVGFTFMSMLVSFVAGVIVIARGGVEQDVISFATSTPFKAAHVFLGASMSVMGGHVAASWARRRHVAHALAAGTLSLVLSLPLLALPGSMEPLWLALPGFVLHLPLAALGGYLVGRRRA